jgi:hypothetical protein
VIIRVYDNACCSRFQPYGQAGEAFQLLPALLAISLPFRRNRARTSPKG